MNSPLRILHLEDDADYTDLVRSMLAAEGFAPEVVRVTTRAEFEGALQDGVFDLILADYLLPDFDGLKALQCALDSGLETPFLLVSGTIGEEAAIRSLHQGATDYVLKQWPERLIPAVQRALRESAERKKRKQAETTLARREKYYRALTENALDIITILSREGLFRFNSPSVERVLGYTGEELAGQNAFSFVHPEDLTFVVSQFEHGIAHPELTLTLDFRFRHKDGSWRYLEAVGRSLLHDPEIAGIVVNSRDITERRWIELNNVALSRLGRRLSSASTQLEAARIIVDVADDLFGWDACTFDLCSQDHATVTSVLNIDTINGQRTDIPPKYLGTPPSPRFRRVLEEGAQLILREDTSVIPADAFPFGDQTRPSASILLVPVRNGAQVVGVLSIQSYRLRAYTGRDLNALQALADHCGGALERLRAQEALKQSEQRFHAIWENSVDGMRLTDKEGVIVAVNESFSKLVGMPRSELEGNVFTACYAADDQRQEHVQKYRQRFKERRIEMQIHRHMTFRSGKQAELEVTNSYVDVPGQEPLLLSLFRDVTERKRLEDQLRQSQKMDAIGQLAGGVAHDFNNIMTIIQGHASLMVHSQQLPESLAGSARQISRATDRATSLTRQLLTFSRRQIVQRKRFDLNDAVTQTSSMLSRILGEDITLELRLEPEPVIIEADMAMIEQIIVNLSVNARDAMPKGGRLTIETTLRDIDTQYVRRRAEAQKGPHVCLCVRDSGCGIAPEHLPRIFEPFFTTKTVGKGTGLGLPTVYGIVKIHHGWIDVSSTVGQGTMFKVFLPATTGPVEAGDEPEPVQAPIRGGTETILLAEDETPVRDLVRTVLKRHGYNVIAAPSGVEALELWQVNKDKVDLLLTDMVMPGGLTGRELAEKVLGDKPDIKVIYTSGYSSDIVGKDFVLREGWNFLQKPFHPHKLARTVRDCLDGK